jgi:methionyl aminopeptidase
MAKIIIKTPQQIKKMREAGKYHAEYMHHLDEFIEPEMATYDVEMYARKICKKLEIIPLQIGYRGYQDAICIGINDQSIHCIPNKKHTIKDGDIVNLDSAVAKNDWCADGGFTKAIGKVDKAGLKLIEVTKQALDNAIEACIEGNEVNHISHAIYDTVKEHGFDVLKRFIGHGIGQTMHEGPNIFNIPVKGKTQKLKIGMTLALDTMVTEGKGEVEVLEDGWSTHTKDGGRFAFFEHTIAVGEEKAEILTRKA